MLEKIPAAISTVLSGLKAALDKAVSRANFAEIPESLTRSSPAFDDGADMLARFTSGDAGVSPPLAWNGLPTATAALVLFVEDAGSRTTLHPLVHLIV
ncbi:hypothetical protein [Methylobacterium sp. P1-11]|uniref:hypothetical protein n=1 Tax=Methylobacterium sp. P1-11 TaxID=2024616 RepID=UPI001FED3826|nr:hypothetical protein [Methylobacterium sp. P1-11]